MATGTIDAHQHVWNLERTAYPWLQPEHGPIFRTFEPLELAPHLQAAGIERTVLVQAANSFEDTDYILEQADRYPWIGAVVGWVPLLDTDQTAQALARYTQQPKFRGIRHLIHDEPDPDWVVGERVLESLALVAEYDLSFDVVAVFPNHLQHVPTLTERIPTLRLVIDHLAKPPIKDGQMEPWATQLARAAQYPNVYAKISGLNTAAAAGWTADDLKPYIDHAMQQFGAERVLWGSDWPVCLLADEYARVWEQSHVALQGYTQGEIDAVFGGTAAQVYKM
jgi:L-fuconolactonase